MNGIQQKLNKLLMNNYISHSLMLFIGLYAAKAAPQLPKQFEELLEHPIVRFIIYFLIVYLNSRNLQISIIIATGMIVFLEIINRTNILPMMDKVEDAIENKVEEEEQEIESSSESEIEKFDY